jgi:uncharacterized protein (DUF952 family)
MLRCKTTRPNLTILYKIMTRAQWSNAQALGMFTGSNIDISDGFIHLSAAHQVRMTAAKHFANQTDLVLVSIAEESLRGALKWETSRGGDLFPHHYGTLPIDSVMQMVDLPLQDGIHHFPEGFPR